MQQHAARRARRLPRYLWLTDPIVCVRRRGLRYHLDLRDNVQRAIYFTGWYERRYLAALVGELRPGDVFVDVGAHIGVHSLEVARRLQALGSGSVVAFEPASDTAAVLGRNVAHNRFKNIRVVRLALGARSDRVPLRDDPERFDPADVAVRSFYGTGAPAESVDVARFDSWAEAEQLPRMDIIKIDVEGAELAVLEGMRASIERLQPRLIGVEIRDYLLKRASVSECHLRNWLHGAGYHLVDLGDLEGNYLFKRTAPG